MPKVAQISINKINTNICKFRGEFIGTPSNELFCNICSTVVNHVKQFFVELWRLCGALMNFNSTKIPVPLGFI